MSRWIVRNVALSVTFWAVFAFLVISAIEVLACGRFEPREYVGAVIGLGIGFTFANPPLPLRSDPT